MEPEKAFVAETTGCLRLETGGPDYQKRIFAFRDRDAIGGSKVVHPGQMGAVLQICIKQKPIFIRIFFISEDGSNVLTLARGRVYGNQAREL